MKSIKDIILTEKEIKLIDDVSGDVYHRHTNLVDKAVKEFDTAKKYDGDEDYAKEISYEATACWSRWHELRSLIYRLKKESEDE